MPRSLTEPSLSDHPLREQGDASVGEWHGTSTLIAGMTREQTRFNRFQRECGLDEDSDWPDCQI